MKAIAWLGLGVIISVSHGGCTREKDRYSRNTGHKSSSSLVSTFTMDLNNSLLPGKAILKEGYLFLQFQLNEGITITQVDVFVNDSNEKKPMPMTCCLTSTLQIIRCSTDPKLITDQSLFMDNGYYNIGFLAQEDFDLPRTNSVRLVVTSSSGVSEAIINFQ